MQVKLFGYGRTRRTGRGIAPVLPKGKRQARDDAAAHGSPRTRSCRHFADWPEMLASGGLWSRAVMICPPALREYWACLAVARASEPHRMSERVANGPPTPRLRRDSLRSGNVGACLAEARASERRLERVAGIEPASSAWKAAALPLCYTRIRALVFTGNRAKGRETN